MPEWLSSNIQSELQPSLGMTAARVALALVFGAAVALLHRWCRGPGVSRNSLSTTLVLLSVLISLVTLVIGNNVARAFGLVGALSIVRFRTVVDDTRDTAFVIFAVAVGMALGAGYPLLPFVGVPAVAVVVAMMKLTEPKPKTKESTYRLTLRTALGVTPERVLETVADRLISRRLKEVSTANKGAALEAAFEVTLAPEVDPISLVAALNAVEGVQGVELRGV